MSQGLLFLAAFAVATIFGCASCEDICPDNMGSFNQAICARCGKLTVRLRAVAAGSKMSRAIEAAGEDAGKNTVFLVESPSQA